MEMEREKLIDFIAYFASRDVGYRQPRRTHYYKTLVVSLRNRSDAELHKLYNKFVAAAL